MRTAALALVGIAIIGSAAGCSSSDQKSLASAASKATAGAAGAESQAASAAAAAEARAKAYLNDMNKKLPTFSNSALVGLATNICHLFDGNSAFTQVEQAIQDQGVNADVSGYTIDTAVRDYCPQHVNLLPK